MRYLALYEASWPQLLRPEDHQHEVGEDTGACANCRLEEAGRKMSAFERACWNWYQETMNSFTLKGGVLGELVRAERLRGAVKQLFIRAVGLIDEMGERVGLEKARALRASSGE